MGEDMVENVAAAWFTKKYPRGSWAAQSARLKAEYLDCARAAIEVTHAPELLAALIEIIGPLNACSDNPNVRDDVCLPVDMTMGELRKARAAITAALGGEGR